MYVTEYRKALRDAGFDGFRVMLFQQTGGLKQATGEEAGLEMNPAFFMGARSRRIIAGDVHQRHGLPPAPVRGRAGRDRPRASRRPSATSTTRSSSGKLGARRRCCAGSASSRRSSSTGRAQRRASVDHRRVLGDDDRGRRQLPAAALPRVRRRRVRHPVRDRLAALHALGGPLRHQAARRAARRRRRAKYGLEERRRSARSWRGLFVGRHWRSAPSSRRSRTPSATAATTCPTWTRSPRPRTTTTTTICAAAKATWRSASSS